MLFDFEIRIGDITKLKVDVIVNAANPNLLHGGGVCGAIHDAAGPQLEAECLKIYPDGIEVGQAVVTSAFNLPSNWVIHVTAPRAGESGSGEHVQLSKCYSNAIRLADAIGAKSIAFPSLGTGIYGWSVGHAAPYAILDGIFAARNGLNNIEKVIMCCFTQGDADEYQKVVSK